MPVRTIFWEKGAAFLIDQTLLPETFVYKKITTAEEMAEAIRTMRIRGAPAIGIAAAFGVVLGLQSYFAETAEIFLKKTRQAVQLLASTRPTAVNLFWALERMGKKAADVAQAPPQHRRKALLDEAQSILEEDRRMCRAIGQNGLTLLDRQHITFLTHCNAGALATADYGTALGIIYAAQEAGKSIRVFSDETRPQLQGSRLTAWELRQANIDVTVICDNMAASLMRKGAIDLIVVGADRIARNGDVANKIGTYNLAVLAKEHDLPFVVAAPSTTFDLTLESGEDIPIEERDRDEVIRRFGVLTAPPDVKVYNPAFDVTPNALVRAIVTEKGILKKPYEETISKMLTDH